jgi:electron transport complex protein RnfC
MVNWSMADGVENSGLLIRLEGEFHMLGKKEERFDWESLDAESIRSLIDEYGVVEMDGYGQPVAELLEGNARTIVVRCVFDDPWLASEYLTCLEKADSVMEGAAIAAAALREHPASFPRIILALSAPDARLGKQLQEAAERAGIKDLETVYVGNRYPQHNSRELGLAVRAWAGKNYLEMNELLPLGASTLAAIRDAVVLHKPILERYVAVGGSSVESPAVMKLRIGSRIRDVFAECGGFSSRPVNIAVGSPLHGRKVSNLDEPVTKTTYALFAMHEGESDQKKQNKRLSGSACISCGECRTVCPVGLDPEFLYKEALKKEANEISESSGAGCHGCACCDLVCPARLPLSRSIVHAFGGDVYVQ